MNTMTSLLIIAAMALALCYIYFLSKDVYAGMISLLAAECLTLGLGDRSQLLGGIHLSPEDAVSMCLLCAGMIRTVRSLRYVDGTRVLVIGYLALFAISVARGIYSNGVLAAANESRGFIGPLAATLYFSSCLTDERSLRKYTVAYLCFGAALCVIAVLAAAGAPVGMSAVANADAAGADGRYLPATGAAAIAVCGFIALALSRYRGTQLIGQLAPMLFMAVAIYLRHRTVWIMLIAGIVAVLPLDAKLFRSILPVTLLAAAVVVVLAMYGGNTEGLAGENQFSQSVTNSQTLEWRLNGWKELLLDDEQNALTIAIGKSMGSGYWRVDPVSYQTIAVAPHSEYVQEYLRVGVVGMLLIVLFSLRPLLRLWRLTKSDAVAVYPSTSTWAIIILVTLVFGVTYGIGPHAYALLGIANAVATGSPAGDQASTLVTDEYEWHVASVPSVQA
jgi:O-antigen ligase